MSSADKIRRTNIGGQAVIEGVMMRGKTMYAMAVRTPDSSIAVEEYSIKKRKGAWFFKLPIVRGVAAFIESLVLGTKIITRSAELAGLAEDEPKKEDEKPSRFEAFLVAKLGDKLMDVLMFVSVAFSLILGVGLFMLLPVWISSFFKQYLAGTWALGILEGVVRLVIFVVYVLLISMMKDIKRVFQYHGAEHKTINCFEHKEELTVENVRKHTRLHKRCGTSFLLIVMLISMLVFVFVRTDVVWMRFASRIILIPFIAGLSYEVIRWAGKRESLLVSIISFPGMCMQKLTTSEPDDAQMEVAIASMKRVLEVDKDED